MKHPVESALASIGRSLIGGFRTRRLRTNQGRYTPHIGAKERARYAGWPDGPMHVTGHQRRAQAEVPVLLAA